MATPKWMEVAVLDRNENPIHIIASHILFNMQELNSLPPRYTNSSALRKVKIATNLYEVRLDKLDITLYKYDFVIPTNESTESIRRLAKTLDRHNKGLRKISYIGRHGNGLMGEAKHEETITLLQGKKEETQSSPSLEIQFSKQYTLEELLGETGNSGLLRKVVRPAILDGLSGKKSHKLTHDSIDKHKIQILPQFRFNLMEVQKKFMMASNIVLKVRENLSLSSYIDRYDEQSCKKVLVGLKVIKNYGKNEVYKIQDIDYSKNSDTIMSQIKSDKPITYEEYYNDKYKLKVTHLNQPLIAVYPATRSSKEPKFIYLLPEFLSLFERVNPSDFDDRLQDCIHKKKMIMPQIKEQQLENIVKELSDGELIKKSAMSLDGFILNEPVIQICGKRYMPEAGLFDFRTQISKPVELKNWGIVYSAKDASTDKADVGRLINYLKVVAGQYGVRIVNDPGEIGAQDTVNDWKKAIDEDIKTYGLPQILLLFLTDEEKGFYADLKKHITMKYKVPSQVIMRKLVHEKTKRPLAITSDILLQIQAKIGATLWEVLRQDQVLFSKKLMYGGLLVSKQAQTFSLSFVGSTNIQGTSPFAYHRSGAKKIEDVWSQYENLLMGWARNYVMNTRSAPDVIFLYYQAKNVEGLSQQHEKSLAALKMVSQKIGEKTRIQNYKPEINFISVEERNKAEFYVKAEVEDNDFILDNPLSGTVTFQNLHGNDNDFYLNASKSHEDTSRPVRYRVIEKGSNTTLETLADFTYEQCFNYYNFKGAVKLPAFLLYAHKLRRVASTAQIVTDIEDKANKTFYFL